MNPLFASSYDPSPSKHDWRLLFLLFLLSGISGLSYDLKTASAGFQQIVVVPDRLPLGQLGSPYKADLRAAGAGNVKYFFSIEDCFCERLPQGLALGDGSTDNRATLVGTPQEAGLFTFTMKVTGGNGTIPARQPYKLLVASMGDCPGIGLEAAASTNENGCFGILCFELKVNPDGCDGLDLFPRTLREANGRDASTIVGEPYPLIFRVLGGAGPYLFELDKRPDGSLPLGEKLPPGLELQPGATPDQALLSGSPNTPGTYNFTVKVKDKKGCVERRSYTLVVVCKQCPAIILKPELPPFGTAVKDADYSQTFTAAGGEAPYTFTGEALPPGLALTPGPRPDQVTLHGQPNQKETFVFTRKAVDKNQSVGMRTYVLLVVCPPINLMPESRPDGMVGTEFNQTLMAGPTSGPYRFSVPPDTLPPGLTLTSDGMLRGRPTQSAMGPSITSRN